MHRIHIVIYRGSTLWLGGTLSLIDQSVLASPTHASSGGCCATIGSQTDFEIKNNIIHYTINKVFKIKLTLKHVTHKIN